ncbi:extracellular solute-binding protein [Micromonospora matsumotoense]|uniref:Carbohydrate ABC transporter substrate-binding protein, CUT1 family n=1 Tax=Micromonospora matsumotoense TaxID=121616 RepID=A0A1C5AUQ5_9ACTN|nr:MULTISPECIES: extracellular solute-binding protein [Micromonospora]GHJ08780.1 sugar ABC transporter substrate-binding protein [Micromonospora sp. AKA109]SCF48893.1 carbohydrate ABC transporter substrate-binding protein, CUT1 family [Micromonospora matsumotoense]
MRTSKNLPAFVTAVAVVLGLSACSGGDDGAGASRAKPTNCTNKIVHEDATRVSVWAWYPNMAKVVDNFNNAHTDVQVCWTNAGQGQPQYEKFQTAISAKKGAPDVVMLESDQLVGFEIQDALVDLAPFGADTVKKNFSEGAWKDVSQGTAVYAIPVDGGPMALIYRTDVFRKYGITAPPKTWPEYAAAAARVKAAGGPVFGDFGSNVPAVTTALMMQKGAQPFGYDLSDKQNITIKLDDQATKDVLTFWGELAKNGLVGKEDQFTTDYISGMVGGKYATYVSAAWAPGYLTGAGVGGGTEKGTWAVAPLPQWDPANPVEVNWGGSTFAVTSQASDKAAAAKVAMGLYADEPSLTDGWKSQTIFPLNTGVLTSTEFVDARSEFFNGQTANRDVYIPAANAYRGAVYSPFTVYYYAQLQAQIVKLNAGQTTGAQAATDLHDEIVKYAKTQGFTVR